jgi:hypothetical protein
MGQQTKIQTSASSAAIIQALIDAGAETYTAAKMLAAQSAQETNEWQAMWNWNLGNIAVSTVDQPWVYQSSTNKIRFWSFDTLADGAKFYVDRLSSWGLLKYANVGDIEGYVGVLEHIHYACVGDCPDVYLAYKARIKYFYNKFGDASNKTLDQQTASASLWDIYDSGGPRPEYILTALYPLTKFRSDHTEADILGVGYTSINLVNRLGAQNSDYLTWPASKQLSLVVKKDILIKIAQTGAIQSGIRCFQHIRFPATVRAGVVSLDAPLVRSGESGYLPSLDINHDGVVVVGDLAYLLYASFRALDVRNAVASAYALRPAETIHDPVYGDDYPTPYLVGSYGDMASGIAEMLAKGITRLIGKK